MITISNNPLVSIIMNCFNSDRYLKEAIDSVIAQTYSNWELVFWDNGSCDTSADIVRGYSDSRIRYFYNADTEPLGKARNRALEKASGELIAFLDCDDIWLPGKLESQVMDIGSDTNVDFLYGNFYSLQDDLKKLAYSKDETLPNGNATADLLVRYRINLQTVIFKASILDKLPNWFDTSLELCEEMDLFLRMSLVSEFAYSMEPQVIYRVHGNQFTVTKFDKFYQERERILHNLCNMDPAFEKKFGKEIRSYVLTMNMDEATDLFLKNRKKDAREKLYSIRLQSLKTFVSWFMTYLPIRVYLRINRALGRGFLYERFRYLHSRNAPNHNE